MRRVYRSRVDWWLMAILVAAIGVSLASSVAVIVTGWPAVPWSAVLGLVVGAGFPCWVLASTRYTLDDDELRVRSGPFSWRIPVRGISRITPTSNPLSSPALSLRRLRIEYGDGRALMVSPADEEDFLREIAARGARVQVPGRRTSG